MKFFKLFEPLSIGKGMNIRNRIVMPAMHLNLADKGHSTKRLSDFYVERAKGGAGLLFVGGIYVDIYGMGVPMMLSIEDDSFIPKLAEMTDAVHKADDKVKIGGQLYHSGRYSFPQIIGKTPISSSATYSKFSKSTPREMTLEDIKREQQAFADAAVRIQKAGFDCVEICGSAGYLFGQYFSPLVNKRTDNYGGSLENRIRFPMETVQAIKAAVDEDFAVGVRMAGDDFIPGSLTYKDKPEIAKAYEEAGIDFINVTGGWHETKIPQLTMDVPRGCYTYLAENIKSAVKIPVFATNRIVDPVMAEEILMANKADAICIGRGLIADPYWPIKAQKGDIHDIMYCVACNQGCFDNVFAMKPVTCLRNARAGNEAKTELNPVQEKKKIMVIGAGPAGLELARVASQRGHEVHIFEKSDDIGGLLNVICVPPGRNEFKRMIDNYKYWNQKLGIKVHYNTKVTIDTVKNFGPDEVYVATGTNPIKAPIKGIDGKNVHWANDALAGEAPIGENNVIIGGGATGIELAIFLAKYGKLSLEAFEFLTFYKALEVDDALKMIYKGKKKVTILEKLPRCGANLGKTTKWVLLEKCQKLGVNIITGANIKEIGEDFISYIDAADTEQILEGIDAVYYATGVVPNDSLYKEIRSLKIPVQKLGDARKPQTVLEAVERSYKLANKI